MFADLGDVRFLCDNRCMTPAVLVLTLISTISSELAPAPRYEDWVARQLEGMREGSLASSSDLAGFRRRLRVVVLPTFEGAHAYRIDETPDGEAILHWVRLDGQAGYLVGRVVEEGSRSLTPREYRRVIRALRAARLDQLSPGEPPEGITQDSSGEASLIICVDGTTYLFEHLDAQRAALVQRHCDKERGLDRLEQTLRRLHPFQRPG